MSEKMTQMERLDFLVEAFKEDSGQYKDIQTPADADGKRRIVWESAPREAAAELETLEARTVDPATLPVAMEVDWLKIYTGKLGTKQVTEITRPGK